jgi:hypothetical protein
MSEARIESMRLQARAADIPVDDTALRAHGCDRSQPDDRARKLRAAGGRGLRGGRRQAYLSVIQLDRDAAREKLRVVTKQYRAQAALLPDVPAAQAALGQASDRYHPAVPSFRAARADFERALGAE